MIRRLVPHLALRQRGTVVLAALLVVPSLLTALMLAPAAPRCSAERLR